jgi:hypothetical protein
MYMKNDADLSIFPSLFPAENMPEIKTPDRVIYQSVSENPVPESAAKNASYFDECFFIGTKELSGLYEYDFVSNNNIVSDDSVNSSNVGGLVVRRGNANMSIKNVILDEGFEAVYLSFLPTDKLDTEKLRDFTGDILSNSPETQIYIISVLPVSDETIITNTAVDTFNSKLLTAADDLAINFIDANTTFKGNDGKLKSEYLSSNGKINRDGYATLANFLLNHTRG